MFTTSKQNNLFIYRNISLTISWRWFRTTENTFRYKANIIFGEAFNFFVDFKSSVTSKFNKSNSSR